MGTILQKRLAHAILENSMSDNPKNKGELLEIAGYSKTTSEATPTRVMQQKGVLEELEEIGFTEENARKVVASILLNEDNDPTPRLKAADMVFKIHGSYAPERIDNKNINVDIDILSNDKIKQLSDKYTQEYLEMLKNQ